MAVPLSSDVLRDALQSLSGWSLADDGKSIRRRYDFADYYRTMAFVNAIAYLAHASDHHPDLSVHYNKCVVTFSTHDACGVTQKDLDAARAIDAL